MKTAKKNTKDRKNEKGAALIMALLISFLLLVASAGLLLEASMNSANVTDAVSEQQAYHAAESGIQSAVHILRCQKNTNPGCGDVVPNPLINTGVAATATPNQINYTKAVDPTTSSKFGTRRDLSRWTNYNSTCGTALVPCVELSTPNYSFSLDVTDPDNTSSNVSVAFEGSLIDHNSGSSNSKTYGTGGNTLTITYLPPTPVENQDLSQGPMNLRFGTLRISRQGSGAVITSDNRLQIDLIMTEPYEATKTIRGWILTTNNPGDTPKVIFDSQTLTLAGSAITLNLANTPSSGWSSIETIGAITPSEPYLGYRGQPTANADNIIGGTMSSPEPVRLLLKSTGYGPRGAKKELQAIIQKNFFMGLTAPAALTLIGPHRTGCDGGLPSSPAGPCSEEASHFYFDIGDSAVVNYSGQDQVSTDIIPPIGTSNPQSLTCVENFIAGSNNDVQCNDAYPNGSLHFNGNVEGSPSDVSTELPFWLRTPQKLDTEIHNMANQARSYGRYFPSGVTPTSFGDVATGSGITFADGDVTLSGDGGGILVVTGTLTLHGAFTFKGLIIVTGRGGVRRTGGGGGQNSGYIVGNVVVAPYQNAHLVDRIVDGVAIDDPPGIFLAPRYDISGGGASNLQFNSAALQGSLVAISNFVLGVMEK